MRSTEPANARLQAVRGQRGKEGWGAAAAAGPSLFAGNVGVYYDEIRRMVPSPGGNGLDPAVVRTLAVSRDLGIAWRTGLELDVQLADATPVTATVDAIEDTPPAPGDPGEVTLTLTIASS